MVLPLPSQQKSSSVLRLILLAVFLIALLAGIFYLMSRQGFFAKSRGPSKISLPPTINLQSAASDPRLARLKSLEPIPALEVSAGRDNPFSAYKVQALTPLRR